MKVAIASSGLGHVARGIETWALDTAAALDKSGIDVTLFTAGDLPAALPAVVLPCLRRFDVRTVKFVRRTPGWAWRWGLKSAYGWEEFTFWLHLWPKLRKGRFDILHVQDSWLAYWCRKFRRLGLLKTKEILAHATEEPPEWLAQFEYVQHLAPWHREQALEALARGCRASGVECSGNAADPCGAVNQDAASGAKPYWTAIPNFVDTDVFRPVKNAEERATCRRSLKVPEDAFVIGVAATVKKPHKRVDYLIREFAQLLRLGTEDRDRIDNHQPLAINHSPFLVVAGAKTPQSDELVLLAEELAPGRVKFLFDLAREQMPDFYRALDVFVLTSLFEMMPIAVLEALASGLPVMANKHPVLEWMTGGETCVDMGTEGALAHGLETITPTWPQTHGDRNRLRAVETYSKEKVLEQCVDYYRTVLGE